MDIKYAVLLLLFDEFSGSPFILILLLDRVEQFQINRPSLLHKTSASHPQNTNCSFEILYNLISYSTALTLTIPLILRCLLSCCRSQTDFFKIY